MGRMSSPCLALPRTNHSLKRQKPVVLAARTTHILSMDEAYEDIRKAVLEAALPEIALDGWSEDVVARAGEVAGIDKNSLHLAFSGGVRDLIKAFSAQGDAAMLATLDTPDDMKIRDRIRQGVRVRLEVDADHRDAARRAAGWMSLPGRQAFGGRLVYTTADHIWHWAGDTATDYNHYSKRLILSGYWARRGLCGLAMRATAMRKAGRFLTVALKMSCSLKRPRRNGRLQVAAKSRFPTCWANWRGSVIKRIQLKRFFSFPGKGRQAGEVPHFTSLARFRFAV